MAYYDLHFMDNILREYFAALPTCILTVVYRVRGAGSNFAGHGVLGSSQHAITILPPPQIVHIKTAINSL